jgi:hypothetical protein
MRTRPRRAVKREAEENWGTLMSDDLGDPDEH